MLQHRSGGQTLRDHARTLCHAGITDQDEVDRVLGRQEQT